MSPFGISGSSIKKKLLNALGVVINPATEDKQDDSIFANSKGVPITYTKQTANSESFLVGKGVLNKLRLRPGRQTLQLTDLSKMPPFIEKGGMLKVEYNDDFTDDVSSVFFGMRSLYIPSVVNG